MKHCSIDGCSRLAKKRGWCRRHYDRWWRNGDPVATQIRSPKMSLSEVVDWLLKRTKRTDSGCLEFQGHRNELGYGQVSFKRKMKLTHRLVVENSVGRSLKKYELACHKCHNPSCINIDHLYVGDSKTNAQDRIRSGRPSNLPVGENHHKAKLTEADVRIIRKMAASRVIPQKGIAYVFGITQHQTHLSLIHI